MAWQDAFAYLREPRFWVAMAIIAAALAGLMHLGVINGADAFLIGNIASFTCAVFGNRRQRDARKVASAGCAECHETLPAGATFCEACGCPS